MKENIIDYGGERRIIVEDAGKEVVVVIDNRGEARKSWELIPDAGSILQTDERRTAEGY